MQETNRFERRKFLKAVGAIGVGAGTMTAGCVTTTSSDRIDALSETLQYGYTVTESDTGAIIVNVSGQLYFDSNYSEIAGDVVTLSITVKSDDSVAAVKDVDVRMTRNDTTEWSSGVLVGSVDGQISVDVELTDLERKEL